MTPVNAYTFFSTIAPGEENKRYKLYPQEPIRWAQAKIYYMHSDTGGGVQGIENSGTMIGLLVQCPDGTNFGKREQRYTIYLSPIQEANLQRNFTLVSNQGSTWSELQDDTVSLVITKIN